MDELNRSVHQITTLVEKIKHNHNVILASVQNNEAKDETNELMTQITKISQRVHGGLKRKYVCVVEVHAEKHFSHVRCINTYVRTCL